MTPGPLKNKVAIVTGASSGIGAGTARALAAEGAWVAMAARRLERLENLKQEINDSGGRAIAVQTDVTNRSDVETMADVVHQLYGRIDILVANAGVMLLSPIERLRVDEWDRMIDVNIKGLLYCVAAVLPTMRAQGTGHIISVGSVAGRRPFYTGAVYSATKFAVRALSAGLREELSPQDNIRITDIQPGVVDTELTDHIADRDTVTTFAERWGDKKKLDSDDIARAIVFVASQPEHVNVNEVLVRPTEQEQ